MMITLELTPEELGLLITSVRDRSSALSAYSDYLHDGEGNKLPGAELAITQVENERTEFSKLWLRLYNTENRNV